jgi:hypothetical protein
VKLDPHDASAGTRTVRRHPVCRWLCKRTNHDPSAHDVFAPTEDSGLAPTRASVDGAVLGTGDVGYAGEPTSTPTPIQRDTSRHAEGIFHHSRGMKHQNVISLPCAMIYPSRVFFGRSLEQHIVPVQTPRVRRVCTQDTLDIYTPSHAYYTQCLYFAVCMVRNTGDTNALYDLDRWLFS